MTTLSLLRQGADGVIYANPANPSYQVRFKTTSAPKSLNGSKTVNYISEIIITDENPVMINGNGVVDLISVRIRASGSKESQARLKAILASVCGQTPVWVDEHVLTGFAPTTLPLVVA